MVVKKNMQSCINCGIDIEIRIRQFFPFNGISRGIVLELFKNPSKTVELMFWLKANSCMNSWFRFPLGSFAASFKKFIIMC